jgi:hypothetical protein
MGTASNNEASSVGMRRRGCLDLRAAGMDALSDGVVGIAWSRAPICHYILVARQKYRFFSAIYSKKSTLN